MLKSFLPYFMLCSLLAINFSALTVVLQMDLIDTSSTTKMISWILTACAWVLVYVNRNR
ncbi:MAG: hypothetical protein DID90_2727553306 [Candidatus Nitrotoga sp. LAW]|nr:MAG: hypothetical protein DID90_2727553306 [Candidatus Nitrotoga sp. LAW]RFC40220.1 MAG: hypothetical protein DID89_2727547199 [Candidatus Nitrotoga sp. CP45]